MRPLAHEKLLDAWWARRAVVGVLAGVAIAVVAASVWYIASRQGVVARVNGEPIFAHELQRMLADPGMQRLGQQGDVGRILASAKGAEPGRLAAKDLERAALRRLIHLRLFAQEAARLKLAPADEELQSTVAQLRRRFEDEKSYAAWRSGRGLGDDRALVDALRNELVVQRVSAQLTKSVRFGEGDLQAYYEAHKDELKIPASARLQTISVADQESADGIVKALKKGADFAALARRQAKGAGAAEGGDPGWVALSDLPPELRSVVEQMAPTQVTGPLKLGAEFLIVRLAEYRADRMRSFAEARADIEQRLLRARQNEVVMGWLTGQQQKAKIEVLL
jgi:hypothetical protein